jgi:hypothetical protein
MPAIDVFLLNRSMTFLPIRSGACPGAEGLLPNGKEDRRLEFIAACVARPGVPYAALVEMFGPVGRKQTHAALRTNIVAEGHQPRMRCHFGVRDHRFSSLRFPPATPPRDWKFTQALWHLHGIRDWRSA